MSELPAFSLSSYISAYFFLLALASKKQAMERTLEGFRGFTSCLSGADEEKGITYGTGAWNMEGIKESRAMVQAYEMGKEI